MKPFVDRPVALFVVATLVAGGAYVLETWSEPFPPTPEPTHPTEPSLGAIHVGSELAGWTVVHVVDRGEGTTDVDVERAGTAFTVNVVQRGHDAHSAPLSEGSYDLFYGTPHDGAPPTSAESMAVLHAIATALRTAEP